MFLFEIMSQFKVLDWIPGKGQRRGGECDHDSEIRKTQQIPFGQREHQLYIGEAALRNIRHAGWCVLDPDPCHHFDHQIVQPLSGDILCHILFHTEKNYCFLFRLIRM